MKEHYSSPPLAHMTEVEKTIFWMKTEVRSMSDSLRHLTSRITNLEEQLALHHKEAEEMNHNDALGG